METTQELPAVVHTRNDSRVGKGSENEDFRGVDRLEMFRMLK